MAQRFFHLVVQARLLIVALVLVTAAAAAWSATRVRFESDLEIWFLEDDPQLATYHRFLETFEADELVVAGVFADDVFTPEVLSGLDALATAFTAVPHVRRVRALTTAHRFEARGDDVAVVPLVPARPLAAAAARDVRRAALDDPLVRGLLVSEDGRAAAVVVEVAPEANTFEAKVALVQALLTEVRAHAPPGVRVRLAGTPVINEAVFRYSQRDFSVLGAIAVALVLLITYLMFRQAWATALPLAVVGLAVLWTFGVMGQAGLHINLVSQSLVVVVFAVGIADSIHVLAEYQRALAGHLGKTEALVEAMSTLVVPCFFTTITTVAGMLSLTTSHLAPVREFGLLAGLGVTFALVLSMTFLPAVLALAPAPSAAALERQDGGPMARLLAQVVAVVERRRAAILATFALAVAGSAALIPRLEVGANPAAYFRADDPVRDDIRVIDQTLGGSTSIELFVTAEDEALKDPARLARLEGLERWLEGLPSVTRVGSITNALAALNLAMTGTRALPRTEAAVAQALLLLEDEPELSALVSEDYTRARVSARVRMSETAALVAEIPRVEAKLTAEFSGPDLRVEPTGFVKLISQMELYIVDSQVRSFLAAFVLISVMMALLLRSVRLGLYAMIPNLGPVVVGLGVMQLLSIRLDPGTAMLGSLTLGLVVDDTVHMTSRIRLHLVAGLSTREAVTRAILEVGRAVIITSLILSAGFGVLALGSFTPNIYLGGMAAVVILLALAADLFVLPAALVRRQGG
ncbi:MAG: MMPL family transporter [Myxococcales bacterium]|nr:MMPL family transporter [Myxococcales bacterium]